MAEGAHTTAFLYAHALDLGESCRACVSAAISRDSPWHRTGHRAEKCRKQALAALPESACNTALYAVRIVDLGKTGRALVGAALRHNRQWHRAGHWPYKQRTERRAALAYGAAASALQPLHSFHNHVTRGTFVGLAPGLHQRGHRAGCRAGHHRIPPEGRWHWTCHSAAERGKAPAALGERAGAIAVHSGGVVNSAIACRTRINCACRGHMSGAGTWLRAHRTWLGAPLLPWQQLRWSQQLGHGSADGLGPLAKPATLGKGANAAAEDAARRVNRMEVWRARIGRASCCFGCRQCVRCSGWDRWWSWLPLGLATLVGTARTRAKDASRVANLIEAFRALDGQTARQCRD